MFPASFMERTKYESGPANCLRYNVTSRVMFAEIFIRDISLAASATTNIDLMLHSEAGVAGNGNWSFMGTIVTDTVTSSNACRGSFICGARWSSSTMNQTSMVILETYPAGSGGITAVNFVTNATYVRIGVTLGYTTAQENGILWGILLRQPL